MGHSSILIRLLNESDSRFEEKSFPDTMDFRPSIKPILLVKSLAFCCACKAKNEPYVNSNKTKEILDNRHNDMNKGDMNLAVLCK